MTTIGTGATAEGGAGVGGVATGGVLTGLQALAEEKRLRIVDLLRDGEQCVCDLTAAMGEGQSLLSHHLKVLREAGLVTDRRAGRWSFYRLVPGALAELESFLGTLREDAGRAGSSQCC